MNGGFSKSLQEWALGQLSEGEKAEFTDDKVLDFTERSNELKSDIVEWVNYLEKKGFVSGSENKAKYLMMALYDNWENGENCETLVQVIANYNPNNGLAEPYMYMSKKHPVIEAAYITQSEFFEFLRERNILAPKVEK